MWEIKYKINNDLFIRTISEDDLMHLLWEITSNDGCVVEYIRKVK